MLTEAACPACVLKDMLVTGKVLAPVVGNTISVDVTGVVRFLQGMY